VSWCLCGISLLPPRHKGTKFHQGIIIVLFIKSLTSEGNNKIVKGIFEMLLTAQGVRNISLKVLFQV
jgi:hypothetical protein